MNTKQYLHLSFSLIIVCLLTSCLDNGTSINRKQIDSLSSVIVELKQTKDSLQHLLSQVQYPASDRIETIKKLIQSSEYIKAEEELSALKQVFPNSNEIAKELENRIEEGKEVERQNQERLEALGFKALTRQTSISLDYNKITISHIATGSQFIFDSYDDRYFYRDADRGNKYLTMSMSVKSENKEPMLPEFAVYKVKGKELFYEGVFQTEYARWSDYGAYLGNYHDSRNDFAKVSTVSFKLGCEISEDVVKGAYAIVMKRENVLSESYDRFRNPPKSWVGSANYPKVLQIVDFNTSYTLVNLANL